MSLLNKAKNRAKSDVKKAVKKATSWLVGDPEGDKVAKSVKELVRISNEVKAKKSQMAIHTGVVSKYAKSAFVEHFAENGVMPETPMKVVNADGDSVTYIVQDRSGQYNLKQEQIEAMNQILGEDVVDDLLYNEVTFSLNREVMAIPGVTEAVDKALSTAVRKLVKDEVIDGDQADELVDVSEKLAFKPKMLQRAATLTGNDKTRLLQFLNAMGSSCTMYTKC